LHAALVIHSCVPSRYLRERALQMFAHQRLGLVGRAGEEIDIRCCPDVAEDHGGVALQPSKLGASSPLY